MTDPRHCPFCGQSLVTRHVERRNRRYCTYCNRIIYQNPRPCAGVLVLRDNDVLLVKRTEPPDRGARSLPAGYLEHDEPPELAAIRELHEETSVKTSSDSLSLIDTVFVERSADNVLVLVYATSHCNTTGSPIAGSDAAAAQFWDIEELFTSESERLESGYGKVIQQAQEYVS